MNFEGRASLSAFWYATLFFTFVSIVAMNLDHGSHGLFAVVDSGPITNLVTLAFLLPNLSVAIVDFTTPVAQGTLCGLR